MNSEETGIVAGKVPVSEAYNEIPLLFIGDNIKPVPFHLSAI